MNETIIKNIKLPKPGALAIMSAAILFSLDGLLRRNLYTVSPAVIVFWEHVLGLAILTPIVLPTWRRFFDFTKKQLAAIVLVSFLSGVLGTLFYTTALGKVNYIQFSVVVLLQQLQPIFAISAATLLLKEKISPAFISKALLALLAAYFVSFPTLHVNFSNGQGTIIAAALALGSAICWGSSTAFSKYALAGTSFLHTTALRFFITPIFAFLFVIVLHQFTAIGTLSSTQFMYLAAIALSTGMVALALYYWGLKRTAVRVTTLLELIWPVSAILIDFFVFKRTLSLTQWLGAIVLVAVTYHISVERNDL